jgi:molecular chaperone DnaJ
VDYYKNLGVNNLACSQTIKIAYLKMVKKLHPDINPHGHEKFTEIQRSY